MQSAYTGFGNTLKCTAYRAASADTPVYMFHIRGLSTHRSVHIYQDWGMYAEGRRPPDS